MEASHVIGVIVLSAAIGLAAYCGACALHVWRSRRARTLSSDRRRGGGVLARCRWLAAAVFLVGLSLVAAGAALALSIRREGVLTGDRLFTARLPKDVQVLEVTGKETVEADGPLARFHDPQREAEIAVARLRLEEIAVAKAALLHTPLEADAELTRQLQDAGAERRHLETALNDRLIERDRLHREHSRELTLREDEISRRKTAWDAAQKELLQAQADLKLNQLQLARTEQLRQRRAASQEQLETIRSEKEISEQEVAKLAKEADNLRDEKTELQQAVQQLVELHDQQAKSLDRQIADDRDRLQTLDAQQAKLQARLEADLARARSHRQKEIERLDIQSKQLQEELAGLVQSLEIKAPVAGRVVYRDPSPQLVPAGVPLLVVAPQPGFRLRVRLPAWEVKLYPENVETDFRLVMRLGEDQQPERMFVEHRFPGTLARWQKLPNDPGYALAEFTCDPPPDVALALASGEEVRARLDSWAPLYSHPLVVAGAIACVLGGAGWTLGSVVARPAASGAVQRRDEGPADGQSLEYGGEGAMLYLLGGELRDTICRGHVDGHVVAAAEWSLDRHRARAVRLLRRGLGDEEELCATLEKYVCERDLPEDGSEPDASSRTFQRLLDVLRVVLSEPYQHRLAAWTQSSNFSQESAWNTADQNGDGRARRRHALK